MVAMPSRPSGEARKNRESEREGKAKRHSRGKAKGKGKKGGKRGQKEKGKEREKGKRSEKTAQHSFALESTIIDLRARVGTTVHPLHKAHPDMLVRATALGTNIVHFIEDTYVVGEFS